MRLPRIQRCYSAGAHPGAHKSSDRNGDVPALVAVRVCVCACVRAGNGSGGHGNSARGVHVHGGWHSHIRDGGVVVVWGAVWGYFTGFWATPVATIPDFKFFITQVRVRVLGCAACACTCALGVPMHGHAQEMGLLQTLALSVISGGFLSCNAFKCYTSHLLQLRSRFHI